MDKKTLLKQVIIEKGGIAKTSDFVAAGIPAVDIVNLCNTGYLERIRHGYYQLADGNTSSEEQATMPPKYPEMMPIVVPTTKMQATRAMTEVRE